METLTLPVGIDSFERIRREGYYYVDKTGFIAELLKKTFEVNLITRPRRFGKSLAVNMLASFFDIQRDSKDIFTGLEIAGEDELCSLWMNQWPVLSLSFKGVEGLVFSYAYDQLQSVISDCCLKLDFLLQSDTVNRFDKEVFERLAAKRGTKEEVNNSIFTLTRMLSFHFSKPVIVLIDEYDVPLAKASENNYYPQMLECVRGLLGKALKSNEYLKFSIITGCLRVSMDAPSSLGSKRPRQVSEAGFPTKLEKTSLSSQCQSIFTGTNNLVTDTISGERFSEYFGFTEAEVLKILDDTEFDEHADEIRTWYDGYHFGKTDIYCPWDVLNHINKLQDQPDARPESYWKNTSHNGIIRSFLMRTDLMVNEKFEQLLAGNCICQKVTEDLSYDVLHSSEENLWTILYLTGYLTQDGMCSGLLRLRIPNEEIKTIFTETVMEWFKDGIAQTDRKELFQALWDGDGESASRQLSDLLFETISYHDYDESYYHAFLAGVFSGAGFAVESNYEYGLGRPDIVVTDKRRRRAIVIETKRASKESQLGTQCKKALKQLEERQYAKGFLKGYRDVICYGISFFEKECLVMKGNI